MCDNPLRRGSSNASSVTSIKQEPTNNIGIVNNHNYTAFMDVLMTWVPQEKKIGISSVVTVYSCERDGWSLQTLYTKCENWRHNPLILLLHVGPHHVIGAYLSDAPHKDIDRKKRQFFGNATTFVFQLVPHPQKYEAVLGGHYIMAKADSLLVGCGSEGSAISLGADLQTGHSSACSTFRSPPLAPTSNFDILRIELLGLV
jgi:hypothetical protein